MNYTKRFTLYLPLLQFRPLREFLSILESWLEIQPLLHLIRAVLSLIYLVIIAKAEALFWQLLLHYEVIGVLISALKV